MSDDLRTWLDRAAEASSAALEPFRELHNYWAGDDGWPGVQTEGPRGGSRPHEVIRQRCWRERTDELLKALVDANQKPQYNPAAAALLALEAVLDVCDGLDEHTPIGKHDATAQRIRDAISDALRD